MSHRKYPPHSILTFTGRIVEPFKLSMSDIDMLDIAKSLSNQCRYLGHLSTFYSVAQHCSIGSMALKEKGYGIELQKGFLLHDASEAYLCDMPSPIKSHPAMREYMDYEKGLVSMIYERYGVVESRVDQIVGWMDLKMMYTEKRDLIHTQDVWNGEEGVEPLEDAIVPLSSDDACAQYIELAGRLL